jgi:hypothetical protein
MTKLRPSLTGLRGTQVSGSISYTLVNIHVKKLYIGYTNIASVKKKYTRSAWAGALWVINYQRCATRGARVIRYG